MKMSPPPKPLTHAESVRRLIREFGADINVRIGPLNPGKSPRDIVRDQRQINASLVNKFPEQDIFTYEFVKDRVPHLTVVWDYAMPDTNPSRLALSRVLTEAGVRRASVAHLWCVPEAMGRPPLPGELAAYRDWLLKGLYAANSKYILLIGARPMWSWRADMRLKDAAGKFFVWKSVFVIMPVSNPLAVMTDKIEYRAWRRMVDRMAVASLTDQDTELMEAKCIKCESGVYWYDSDGVPWCKEHFEQGDKDQTKGVKEWQTRTIDAGNRSMFPNTDS